MRHRLAPLVLALGVLSLAGCGFFKPTAPERPQAGGGAQLTPDYTEPSNALETLLKAMNLKNQANGADAWVGAFASPDRDGLTTLFGFDPIVLAAKGGQDPGWDLVRERKFYTDMSAIATQAYFMTWELYVEGGDDIVDAAADTAHLERRYKIYLVDAENNVVGSPIAIGIAKLSFKKTSPARWAIFRWMDFVDPTADPKDPSQVSFSTRRLDSSQ